MNRIINANIRCGRINKSDRAEHIGHNGYYLEGLFDEYHKQNGLGGDTEGYYQYDLKMIDNIYP